MGHLNFLVIVLDALRADSVSCYGYSRKTTPHLDRFSNLGARFKRAYSSSTWTIPSHASMLSGLYLSEHRIENIHRNRRFNSSIVPLPVALQRGGYKTVLFSENPLFSPQHNFDYFDQFVYGGDEDPLRVTKESQNSFEELTTKIKQYLSKTRRSHKTYFKLFDWMDKQQDDPFFVMVNLLDIHYPWAPSLDILVRLLHNDLGALLKSDYVAPNPWQFNAGVKEITSRHRRVWRNLYDAAIMHADRELGRFLKQLGNWRGWRNLVVIITSDHGDLQGDYRDIVGHMLTLNDKLIHVPLIVRHPNYVPGMEVEGVVQIQDLYSSILEWSGAPRLDIPSAQLRSSSCLRALEAPNKLSGYAFAEEDYTQSYQVIDGLIANNPNMSPSAYPRRQVAVHSNRYKYVWYDDRASEFFDLSSDPDEEQNLLPQYSQSALIKDFEGALEKWRTGLVSFPPEKTLTAEDEAMTERLRKLGYVA